MPTVERRPFSAEERRVITSLASGRGELANDISGAGCVFVIVLGLGLAVIKLLGLPAAQWQPPVALLGLVVGVLVALRMRRGRKRWTTPYALDLSEGEVEIATFEVRDAIRIEEFEDEGSQYYLQLADGGVLFLGGQYLYDPEAEGRFPSTRVRTTRTCHSRTLLDIECLGTPLAVSTTRGHFDEAAHRSGAVPEDGQLLQIEFESLRVSAR